MSTPRKIIAISLISWAIIEVVIFFFSLLSLADPFFALNELFSRYDATGTYNFSYFGIVFNLWATSTFLSASGLNLLTPPLSIESLFPPLLLIGVTAAIGYYLGFVKAIPTFLLLLAWGTILGLVLAILIPFTVPTAGLSPEDKEIVNDSVGDFLKMTFLIPVNLLFEVLFTIGLCLGGVAIGGIGLPKLVRKQPNK
ncbi:MAG: hypothetical protein ACFFCW_35625 [Candidatus Hodarchaeota archaeon]